MCRRLAANMTAERAIDALQALAIDYDLQADATKRESGSVSPPR